MQTYLVDIDDTVYSRTYQLDDDLQNLSNITVFEGVHEFCSLNPTVFVSKGDPLLQMKKLRILGLLSTADGIHIVPTNEGKLAAFKLYTDSVVIGNRRDAEIRQGNRAGHHTVLVKHGKYAGMPIECNDDVANEEFDCITAFIKYK